MNTKSVNTKPGKPKFIYFDLGNVLLNFDHEIACRQVGQLCDRSPDEVRSVIFESDLQHLYEAGQITTDDFFVRFCEELKVTADKKDVMLAASAIFTPNYSILPVVSQLQRAGVRIGILSNTCAAHWEYISEGRYRFINDLFRIFALSFELKSSKPDKAIYQRSAELCGFVAEQIFFVDDKPENVQGASEAGFDAVLFRGTWGLIHDLKTRDLLPAI